MGCLQWSTLETKDCTINTLRFWNIAIARREVHSKRKFFLVRFPSFWKPLIFQLHFQLPPRHRLKAARFQRKFWRKFNGLLNASQTFYSDNGSQRAPPLRFESRPPEEKDDDRKQRMDEDWWEGLQRGELRLPAAFLAALSGAVEPVDFTRQKGWAPISTCRETLSRDHEPSSLDKLPPAWTEVSNNNSGWKRRLKRGWDRLTRIFIFG